MKTKRIFNLNKLVSVKIEDVKICYDLEWLPFKKGILSNRKEGFYAYDYYYTIEEIENGSYHGVKLLVKDNVAYFKPSVTLSFDGDIGFNKEFDTHEEASAWANQQVNNQHFKRLDIED